MEIFTSYNFIIATSVVIILSFFFNEISKKTNIPSVLMLIVLGMIGKVGFEAAGGDAEALKPALEILGIVGLIMIVLEAALELKLDKDKLWPILKALAIAFIGLLACTYVAALILERFIDGMDTQRAWLYATPISILSSAIIIPSVGGLKKKKKEFHVYESTFSDILGIIMFYYLTGQADADAGSHGSGLVGYGVTVLITIVLSFVASYVIVFIFQNIKSHTKLFLLIAVLLLLYALGKLMHLSSLIIILIFGLVIANIQLFFRGWFAHWLDLKKAKEIYDGLHIITLETAFVVRTFFFVVFGLTIAVESLFDLDVALISLAILVSIYIIRFVILFLFYGRDINPQLWIAPRGLITILLFYAIPDNMLVDNFNPGILLYIILGSSLIMTFAMIADKKRTGAAVNEANSIPVGVQKWKAPSVDDM